MHKIHRCVSMMFDSSSQQPTWAARKTAVKPKAHLMFTRLEIKRLLHCKHYYSTPFFWMTEVCEFEWNDSLIKVSTKRSKIVTLDFRKHHDDCTVDMNRNIISCIVVKLTQVFSLGFYEWKQKNIVYTHFALCIKKDKKVSLTLV